MADLKLTDRTIAALTCPAGRKDVSCSSIC